jgi:hypothetical protein
LTLLNFLDCAQFCTLWFSTLDHSKS